LFGQKEDRIWYFGGDPSFPTVPGAGLDFNSGSPVPLTNSAMGYTEGSAVQADRNGNLLFYTNGMKVWDRTHAVMMNGTGLGGHVSSEQSSLIIPFPNYTDTNKFYLFANDGFPTSPGTGLHYSIIDMNLNGGLGAVTAVKAVPLLGATTEWLTGTTIGSDFWVITADYDSTIFYAYKITSSGISPPVITNLGFNTEAYFKLDFNNKGDKVVFKNKIAFNLYVRMIASFDQNTGIFFNPIALDTTAESNDGAGFSPNDSLLYCVSKKLPLYDMYLYQYKLYDPNIYASQQTILQFTDYPHLDMKNAPDGKLYVSNATTDSLDRINFPNLEGVACNYERNAIYLSGRKYRFLFPNRTFEIAKVPLSASTDDLIQNTFNLYPNPSHGHFQLTKKDKATSYFIYNSIGEQIHKGNFNQTGLETISLELEKGIYLIKVSDDIGNCGTKKLIIN
jgi:hypothetical protein